MQRHPLFRPGKAGTVTYAAPKADPASVATFVGMPIDFHGVFSSSSSFEDDLSFIQHLEATEPAYARALIRQGQELVRLASSDGLRQIMALVGRTKPRELLPYFTAKMFLGACFNGHINVMRYMLQQGFDYTREPCKYLLHRVVDSQLSTKRKAAVLQAVCRLGYHVDEPAPPLGFTPLHVAVATGDIPNVASILSLGADVNAVANKDVMPLTLAVSAAKCAIASSSNPHLDWQSETASLPQDVKVEDLAVASIIEHPMVHLLVRAGAKLTWRADGVISSTKQPTVQAAPSAPAQRTTTGVSTGPSAGAGAAASGAGDTHHTSAPRHGPTLVRQTPEHSGPAAVQPSAGMLSLVEQYKQQKLAGSQTAAAVPPLAVARPPPQSQPSLSDSPMMLFSFGSASASSQDTCPREQTPGIHPPPQPSPHVLEHADGSLTFSTE